MALRDRIKARAALLKRDVLALWFAVRDPRTPWSARALALLVVTYALSPIDLIPDFIPVLGYVDELLLLPLAIWAIFKLVPREVLAQSRAMAEDWLASGRRPPRSRVGAVLVIAVWVVLVWWLIALFAPSLGFVLNSNRA
ncbi:MAG TPA: YkvA family protein [Burkholderiales bacterium]|jgi:uncharacterized membrane protein YkvA (DUF1232 family)|nr:YkvA family protein [Burkholderiales bacterium]